LCSILIPLHHHKFLHSTGQYIRALLLRFYNAVYCDTIIEI
jgi:hypothetical protein